MHLNFPRYILIFDYMGHCSMSILLSNQSAAWVFFNLLQADRNIQFTDGTSMVYFTQCLFHLYNEDSFNYNEDCFILYICILYVYIWTTSVLQIDVAIVTFDILQNCDRNFLCTDGTSRVHFTQCLFHLYNEDSYNYNEDCFILFICMFYKRVATFDVLQLFIN
jgi:hypothetical protein